MVITLVVDTFDVDNNGTTVSAKCLASELTARGHDVRILTCGDSACNGVNPDTGLDMYYVPELKVPGASALAHKQNTLFGKPVRDTVTRAVKGADVVHTYQPWPMDALARRVAGKLGIPVVAGFHIQPENITYNLGLGWFPPAATAAYRILHLLFYRHFDDIHCPSAFIAAQLRRHGYRENLHVVSNGVRPEFFEHSEAQARDDGMFRILMSGRLSPEKHQDVLIEAAMRSRHCDRIQLCFAGLGPRAKAYKKLAAKLPNPASFGYYDERQLIELMRSCDLYVHTSDVEIEGISCMEAFSTGLVPVISDSRASATAQFALCEQSRFKAGDAQDLADEIDYWIDHPARRQAMGEAYAREGARLSLEHSVDKMERMYRMLPRPRDGERPPHSGASRIGRQKSVYWHGAFFNAATRVFYTIAIPLLFVWTLLVNDARVHGIRNTRGLGGAVIVCNHVHMLDSAMTGIAVYPRKPISATIPENVYSLFPGVLVRLLGGVPLPRGSKDLDVFFQEMELALANGRMVLFFPEGDLFPYYDGVRDFNRGAFHLAAKARVPVLPVALSFRPARGPWRLFKKKPAIRVAVGEPIRPLATDLPQDEQARMRLAHQVMADLSV